MQGEKVSGVKSQPKTQEDLDGYSQVRRPVGEHFKLLQAAGRETVRQKTMLLYKTSKTLRQSIV